jgi:cell division protein FtsN|tara:strand:- start:82 stop:657 length:576 start_codon:yes stop_codon:yes gene_type:complete
VIVANPSTSTKRKRNTGSATRRTTSQTKKKSADTPLFNASHVNGFIVGVMTGAIASLGIVAGINPTALPAAITPSTAGTAESTPQPSFTFFNTLEDESFSLDTGRSVETGPSEYTQYVLQAGSFRAIADADRRRGELALLGLESSIEQMNTDTGSWHRVYIGPFDSRSAMAKARALTAQSDIDTLLLKRAQ